MSIESHLVSLRTYLEEVTSQNKRIITLLEGMAAQPQAAKSGKPDAHLAAVTQDVLGKQAKPIPAANVEKQLEAETGHDVVRTGSKPPTFVETDKPTPKKASK